MFDRRPARSRLVGLWAGPALAGLMWAACVALTDLPAPAVATAVISTLTAVWWVLEPIAIPATTAAGPESPPMASTEMMMRPEPAGD